MTIVFILTVLISSFNQAGITMQQIVFNDLPNKETCTKLGDVFVEALQRHEQKIMVLDPPFDLSKYYKSDLMTFEAKCTEK